MSELVAELNASRAIWGSFLTDAMESEDFRGAGRYNGSSARCGHSEERLNVDVGLTGAMPNLGNG